MPEVRAIQGDYVYPVPRLLLRTSSYSVEIDYRNSQKQHYQVEYSDAWVDPYQRADKFFVYILEFDDGNLYVSYTSDLREHKEQRILSAAGRNPELGYLHIVATERAAELRETELKRLINSNPRQIDLMISEFHGRMRELGFEQDS